MVIDICIKFREYSLSGVQVIEWTQFVTDRQTERPTDRRTDGRTDGRSGKNNISPDPEGGDIIIDAFNITSRYLDDILNISNI